jgi:hypothetical protein
VAPRFQIDHSRQLTAARVDAFFRPRDEFLVNKQQELINLLHWLSIANSWAVAGRASGARLDEACRRHALTCCLADRTG